MPPRTQRLSGLTFDLTRAQRTALEQLAGGKGVRLSGYIKDGAIVLDHVAINSAVVELSFRPFTSPSKKGGQ